MQMTTNLNAVAGPSRMTDPADDPTTPLIALPDPFVSGSGAGAPAAGVSKPGLSVDENGDVVKVPAFLNKLYSMVSDPETDELIYWAPSGDSFYVPDHERFGKELLPRFFKHSNFSSFVRQLNMYGFHKVPHLQSGVLKNEAPSELWEFVSPFFKRGHRDLLSRVTRKNHRPAPVAPAAPAQGSTGTRASARQAAMPTMHLLTDGTTEGEAATSLVGPTGQLIDLVAIQSGINAIRQTQAAIGADLKALQTSNEHLWREALESRERQQKHEETIDLIVSFLERLFGTEGEGLKGLKEAMRRGGLGRQREDSGSEETTKKRRRVGVDRMLGDGREPDSEESRFHEIVSEPSTARIEPYVPSAKMSRSSSSGGARVTPLSTEDEANGVSPFTSGATSTSTRGNANQTLYPSAISPMSDAPSDVAPASAIAHAHFRANAQANANALAPYASYGYAGALPSTPAIPADWASNASGVNLDPALMQTTIGSLLQSPAAAQMFLNSLNASAQGQALVTPTKGSSVGAGSAASSAGTGTGAFPPALSPDMNDPTLALFSPLPAQSLAALDSNTADLISAYEKADGVGKGVDSLQDSIDSLVRSMGLDLPAAANPYVYSADGPGALAPGPQAAAAGLGANPVQPDAAAIPDSVAAFDDANFNVDDFLESLAHGNEQA
ncbi:Heat shock transcription factor [Cryptotrichosporon argae]